VPPSLRDLVHDARARLAAAGIESNEAAMDATGLARYVLGWELARFVAHDVEAPPDGFPAAFESVVARRGRREPMSSITLRRAFWGLDFEVGPDVLAPRPETELIVEAAVACLETAGPDTAARFRHQRRDGGPAEQPLIVDVGTGSGCLAVCLALECPGARVLAVDLSPAALAVAARNAGTHGVGDRVAFLRASLLEGVRGPAAIIVSNPPYIPSGDIAGLPPEVRDWEPRLALDGGPDGLDMVRALLASAPRVLAPGGWLIMEFGYGQKDGVEDAMRHSPLELVALRHDLRQIPRTLVARMPEQHSAQGAGLRAQGPGLRAQGSGLRARVTA
jgi:release factor glutamine methyltransferase